MQMREEDFVSRLFVASTHAPVLFFSSRGRVYKEKVWRLPLAAPQATGKALINILPLEAGETITTIMPLPEDEKSWANLDVMFATTKGTVRRNKLSDFVDVRPLRHHRDEARRRRGDRRRADLHRKRRRAADDGGRAVHPFRRAGGARVRGPHVDGRARHHSRRRRPRHFAVDPAAHGRHGRRARRLSQARERCAARSRRGGSAAGRGNRERNGEKATLGAYRARRAALCRTVGRGAVRAHGRRPRFRQAHVFLRVPNHRPRRQRHRGDERRPRRPAGSSARSRWRRATSSCWSPTRAS